MSIQQTAHFFLIRLNSYEFSKIQNPSFVMKFEEVLNETKLLQKKVIFL